MSRLSPSALAAVTVLVVCVVTAAFGFGSQKVGAQDRLNASPVLVVNDATAPVAVMDTSPASRRIPWRKWTVLHLDQADYRSEPVVTVPKGFRLHITDINAFGCVEALKDDMAVNLTLWPRDYPGQADPNMPPDTDQIPRTALMMQSRGVFRNMMHWGGAQQPNVFVDEGETIWAETYRSSSRLHAEMAVWVVGFLEPMAGGGVKEPGW